MARGEKTASILDEIAKEVATESPPDYVDIAGTRYYREKAAAEATPQRRRMAWVNPRKPADAPVERDCEFVAINVAPYAEDVRLDGVIYAAGRGYWLPVEVAATVREICQRTWQHEASTGGAYSHGTNQPVRGSRSQVGMAAPGITIG